MIEWRDEGVVLGARPLGEADAIVEVLTRERGRVVGVVKGARSRARRALMEPGLSAAIAWRARLAEHMGTMALEPMRARAGLAMAEGWALAGLAGACAVASAALPEREPHPMAHEGLEALLERLAPPGDMIAWGAQYARWELQLLAELGFGLDLSACAATGARDDLVYVSPRSGRAVSASAGAPYAAKLLALPSFLLGAQIAPRDVGEIASGLALTGFFLEREVFAAKHETAPPARARLVARYAASPR